LPHLARVRVVISPKDPKEYSNNEVKDYIYNNIIY